MMAPTPTRPLRLIAAALALCAGVIAPTVQAQNSQPQQVGAPDVDANVDIDSQSEVNNDAQSQSGGNVFDFSNSTRNTPPGPTIGAFGGGSCVGPGEGFSGSAPGVSLGYGKSYEDESCQRRNWVQTLIGAAQHMPEQEATALKKAAVEIMMQDEYAGAAFRALGYESARERRENAAQQERAAAVDRAEQEPAATPAPAKTVGRIASSCTVVVPVGAPAAMAKLLQSRECAVEVQ